MRKTKKIRKKRRKLRLTIWGRLLVLFLAAAVLCLLFKLGVQGYKQFIFWLYPTPYYTEISQQAEECGLDTNLLLAVAKVESGFNPAAISPVGAVGIMQVMPDTAAWLANRLGESYNEDKLAEPDYNIYLGARYLRFLLDYWDNDVNKAIASYNAGQNKVSEWLKGGTWDGTLENADDIPYEETRDYLKKVLEIYQRYRELY